VVALSVGAVPFPIAIGMQRIAGTIAERTASVDGHEQFIHKCQQHPFSQTNKQSN